MLTILAVFLSLSTIIFFHEFGHFIFSRLIKIKVEEFGFGYPPRLVGLVKLKRTKKWKIFFGKEIPKEETASTIYSLNLIPFGGFNKIKGEEVFQEEKIEPDSFYAKSWWQRLLSLSGGIVFNIILAMILTSIGFKIGIPTTEKNLLEKNLKIKEVGIQIISIKRNSPANRAGLILGDIILKIDNYEFKEEKEMVDYIDKKANQEITLKVKRGRKELDFKVIPKPAQEVFSPEELEGRELKGGVIGVSLAKVRIVSYPLHLAILKGIKTTFITFARIIQGVVLVLKELVIKQKMIGEAVGVVGIATFLGEAYQVGFIYLLQFVALISLAIAITQLIPFPALDGGRIIFVLIEAIRKKPIDRKIEAIVHQIGFTILLLLLVFITYRDLMRLGEKIFK